MNNKKKPSPPPPEPFPLRNDFKIFTSIRLDQMFVLRVFECSWNNINYKKKKISIMYSVHTKNNTNLK